MVVIHEHLNLGEEYTSKLLHNLLKISYSISTIGMSSKIFPSCLSGKES